MRRPRDDDRVCAQGRLPLPTLGEPKEGASTGGAPGVAADPSALSRLQYMGDVDPNDPRNRCALARACVSAHAPARGVVTCAHLSGGAAPARSDLAALVAGAEIAEHRSTVFRPTALADRLAFRGRASVAGPTKRQKLLKCARTRCRSAAADIIMTVDDLRCCYCCCCGCCGVTGSAHRNRWLWLARFLSWTTRFRRTLR
jgi:hypothetical protein